MRPERFRTLVDAYGADPARWPARERAAAEALLAGDEQAHAVLDEAAALDRILAGAPPVTASTGLRDVIRRMTQDMPQHKPLSLGEILASWLPGRRLWPNLAGLAVALVLGVTLGASDIGVSGASAQTVDDLGALMEPLSLDNSALYGS